MHELGATEEAFYKEIQYSINRYMDLFTESLINKSADTDWMSKEEKLAYKQLRELNLSKEQVEMLRTILSETCQGVVHSLLVSIDGGTALSSEGKALQLIDFKTGEPLTKGALHENFMDVMD